MIHVPADLPPNPRGLSLPSEKALSASRTSQQLLKSRSWPSDLLTAFRWHEGSPRVRQKWSEVISCRPAKPSPFLLGISYIWSHHAEARVQGRHLPSHAEYPVSSWGILPTH